MPKPPASPSLQPASPRHPSRREVFVLMGVGLFVMLIFGDWARSLLTEYREKLDAIARRLMEVETVDAAEFERLFPAPNGTKKTSTPRQLSVPA